jgi:hypothetical protein
MLPVAHPLKSAETALYQRRATTTTITLTIQGTLIRWQDHRNRTIQYRPDKRRGCITRFSEESRWRLIQLLCTVDWAQCMPCSFVTLTYPDTSLPEDPAKQSQNRWVIWRHLERHAGRILKGPWRVEWKERLTGALKGTLQPHLHFIVAACPYVKKRTLEDMWCSTIHHLDRAVVDVRRAKSVQHVQMYIGKYTAKDADVPLLDYAAYLNSGRAWGCMRRSAIPMAEKQVFTLQDGPACAALRGLALGAKSALALHPHPSFSLIGSRAEMFLKNGKHLLDRAAAGQ